MDVGVRCPRRASICRDIISYHFPTNRFEASITELALANHDGDAFDDLVIEHFKLFIIKLFKVLHSIWGHWSV